jgi:hypothetical protein
MTCEITNVRAASADMHSIVPSPLVEMLKVDLIPYQFELLITVLRKDTSVYANYYSYYVSS